MCVCVIFVHMSVSVFRLLCALTEETCPSLATVLCFIPSKRSLAEHGHGLVASKCQEPFGAALPPQPWGTRV